MNYELKNDHELSSAVLSIKVLALGYKPNIRPSIPHEGGSSNAYCGNTLENFDINNPADMWPIILGNDISVSPSYSQADAIKSRVKIVSNGMWIAEVNKIDLDEWHCGWSSITDKNPLRAAAIVFLMMQEAK